MSAECNIHGCDLVGDGTCRECVLEAERDRYREALKRIVHHRWDVMASAESDLQAVKLIAHEALAVGGDPE